MDEKTPQLPLAYQERVKAFNDELDALMSKYHLKLQGDMDFPQYKILPPEVQLALIVLEQHKARFMFKLEDTLLEDSKKEEGEPNANQG